MTYVATKLTVFITLVAATMGVILFPPSTTEGGPGRTFGMVSAGVLALNAGRAGIQWWSSRRGSKAQRKLQVETHLLDILNKIYRDRVLISPDYRLVSLHAWMVPRWYRTLFPFRFRNLLRPMGSKIRPLRPGLELVAKLRTETLDRSAHRWTKDKGIFRLAMARSDAAYIPVQVLDYSNSAYSMLASGAEQNWDAQPSSVTLNMSFDEFRSMHSRYSQVAAVQIRRDGEPVGCLTLEIPHGFSDSLIEQPSTAEDEVGTRVREAIAVKLRDAAIAIERQI